MILPRFGWRIPAAGPFTCARLIFVLSPLVQIAQPARAEVLEVPGQFITIAAALSAAGPGDRIEIAPGIYASSTNGESFPLRIAVDDLVFAGAGGGQSVLDAEGQAGILLLDAAVGGLITGLELTGGHAERGGAIELLRGDFEIRENLILRCGARLRGSGIHVEAASPWIHHNVLWECFDTDLADPGDPHGIQISTSGQPLIENNLVGRGDSNGLLFDGEAAPVIRQNIFLRNGIVGLRGRGLCALGSASAVIAHNLFFENAIASLLIAGEGDRSAEEANDLDRSDSIFGNLEGDPRLNDPEREDFTLTAGSAAIDAGDPSLPGDPDGTVADIGPFFVDQGGGSKPLAQRVRLRLLANVPNPFNPRTQIRFRLEEAAQVRLSIFDLRGRRVRGFPERSWPAGTHAIVWDATDDEGRAVVSGIYRARVEAAGIELERGLTLVR